MNFADLIREESKWTTTENGAVAMKTTGNALLDFFSTIGALRDADDTRVERLFAEAYKQFPLMAVKTVFYGRDVRGGLGERKLFRTLIRYMAKYHPEGILPNLDLIGVYGRYDDMYALIGTPIEDDMWKAMKAQFEEDVKNLHEGKAVSLLAKWIATADASSRNTRKVGIYTAHKLGYPVYNFKRIVRQLRKRIRVVESLMSAGKWNEIEYSEVPSRAMMIYRNAFRRHDEDRFEKYIDKAVNGETKINSSTLYPYDLIEKVIYRGWTGMKIQEDASIEAQWRQLPNYVEEGTNAIVMADTSGSMSGRPLSTAIGLAIYFAERNKGLYHNLWMTFSARPAFQILRGETLAQKLSSMDMSAWNMNTDLHMAFMEILNVAVKNNTPQEDMPKSLIVISDMEIDRCSNKRWTFYDQVAAEYELYGYQIPNVIFWNVKSRHDIFHADATRKGVQLASGQSVAVFKQVLSCIGMSPVEAMVKTLSDERYDAVTVDVQKH